MRVRVRYRFLGSGRIKPYFMAQLQGEYAMVVDGVRYPARLQRAVLTVITRGRVYRYYVSTVDCRRHRLLCAHLKVARPREVEVVKTFQLPDVSLL